MEILLIFFFSSRRRRTRSYGDWSSDVYSSDLHVRHDIMMFTCEHYDVVPDMLVIGKGLGGGVFPLAALIAREDLDIMPERSEERRVGKECRSRWWRCQ